MTTFDKIASSIIKEQELIIGPLAWDSAALVQGLTIVNKGVGAVTIDENTNKQRVIDRLVNTYVELFGRAAKEICRESSLALLADLPAAEVPSSLK